MANEQEVQGVTIAIFLIPKILTYINPGTVLGFIATLAFCRQIVNGPF